jgi:hypothetical protein
MGKKPKYLLRFSQFEPMNTILYVLNIFYVKKINYFCVLNKHSNRMDYVGKC